MTKQELSVKACQYAVSTLIQEGSIIFGTRENDDFETIEWSEVSDWLDDELIKAKKLKEY